MKIEAVMQDNLVSIYENDSMSQGLKKLRDNHIKHLPVVDDGGQLTGIITDRDLKRASASDATALEIHELPYLLDKVRMKEIMTSDPLTVTPDTGIGKAAGMMAEGRLGCLPVLQGDRLVGMVTRTDFLKLLAENEVE